MTASHPEATHISVSMQSKGVCAVCGKRTIRTATFYDPRSINGTRLGSEESYRIAITDAEAWRPDHNHRNCKE